MQLGVNEHKFNDDLLANDDDRSAVHELYPTLEHVLYHQELVDYFKIYNGRADAAKKTSRTWGKRAITLGAIAIVLAAVEITAEKMSANDWPLAIGGVAAFCGLSSVVIGAFSVLFGARKREWLHNRFMGERIRQFHFQSFIAQLPQILDSSQGENDRREQARAKFGSDRSRLFMEFQNEFGGNLDGKFTSVIGPHGEAECWLQKSQREFAAAGSQLALDPFFGAYRQLRIKHQLGYANFKLQGDHKVFSSLPLRQAEVLENISKAGIAWLFLIHLCVLIVVLFTIGILIVGVQLDFPVGRQAWYRTFSA